MNTDRVFGTHTFERDFPGLSGARLRLGLEHHSGGIQPADATSS
jgi:hypothetical protein